MTIDAPTSSVDSQPLGRRECPGRCWTRSCSRSNSPET